MVLPVHGFDDLAHLRLHLGSHHLQERGPTIQTVSMNTSYTGPHFLGSPVSGSLLYLVSPLGLTVFRNAVPTTPGVSMNTSFTDPHFLGSRNRIPLFFIWS